MSQRTRHAIVAALGLGAALTLLLYQQVRHLDSVPDLGDPLFSVWRIGWVNHQLFTEPHYLFDANIFYPERLTLTLSDPVILPSLMGAPLLAIGLHPVVVYNLLLVSAFWFSGIAVYLLVERLTASPRAAFVAGLIYACCGYRFDHYSHLELQMTQWMPLGLLALHLLLGGDPGSGIRDPRTGIRDPGSGDRSSGCTHSRSQRHWSRSSTPRCITACFSWCMPPRSVPAFCSCIGPGCAGSHGRWWSPASLRGLPGCR